MRRSENRILVSHAGNLPRPAYIDELIDGGRAREKSDRQEYHARLPKAITEVVDKQIEYGVDIVNDGEYAKAGSYGGYMQERVSGYSTVPVDPNRKPKRSGTAERDRRQFPGFYASGLWFAGSGGPVRPGFSKAGDVPRRSLKEQVCTGPLRYVGQEAIAKDIAALKEGLKGKSADGFIAALGPLSCGAGARNEHYRDERDYMMAVAETMREEYQAITDAGLIVQIDEPEFATTWMFYPDWNVEQYRNYLERAVEVINHALEELPEEQIRFHMCWGSGHRPHTNDIEFVHIADLLLTIKAQAYAFEASNVRHAHEWRVFESLKLPEGKILV